jgi:hypothetical protein
MRAMANKLMDQRQTSRRLAWACSILATVAVAEAIALVAR